MSRPVKIMSIAFKPDGERKMLSLLNSSASELNSSASELNSSAREGLDLIILPETCLGNQIEAFGALETLEAGGGADAGTGVGAGSGEPGGGNNTAFNPGVIGEVQKTAASLSVNIVFPVYISRCGLKRVNAAIVIDRRGRIAAVYEKLYPYWSEFDLEPPCAVTGGGDCAVALDFGKIGLAVCFDANFPGVWQNLRDQGAELVVWSSAYSAGSQLAAYSLIHHYPIVTSTQVPDAAVFDIDGREILYKKGEDSCVAEYTLDLDRCIFHENFNQDKAAELLRERGDDIEIEKEYGREQWFIMRAKNAGASARELAALYGMTELTAYQEDSRAKIDAMRI